MKFQHEIEKRGSVKDYEIRLRKKDGTIIDSIATSSVRVGNNGRILGYQGIIRDITRQKKTAKELRGTHEAPGRIIQRRTAELMRANKALQNEIAERRKMEEARKESEKDYRSIFENALEGICRSTVDGRFLMVNPALVKMLGYDSEEELLTVDIATQVYYDPLDRLEFQRKIAEKGQVTSLELRMKKKNGELIFVNVNDRIQKNDEGSILYYEATIEDITERKRAELELQKAKAELENRVMDRTAELKKANEELLAYQRQLRTMASELSLMHEEERRKLSTFLHDNIGQSLAVARIKLKELRENLQKGHRNSTIDQILELIEFAIQETRSMTFDLSPPVLYELGFEAALEWLAEKMKTKYGLRILCEGDGNVKPLETDVKVVLFQGVQEVLMNVVKHAHARMARITLARENGVFRINVMDDGRGFDSNVTNPFGMDGGFGLFNIRERLKHLGGSLQIRSVVGAGTEAQLIAPLGIST